MRIILVFVIMCNMKLMLVRQLAQSIRKETLFLFFIYMQAVYKVKEHYTRLLI